MLEGVLVFVLFDSILVYLHYGKGFFGEGIRDCFRCCIPIDLEEVGGESQTCGRLSHA